MAHNIDMSNGRENFAFLGSRKDIWHGLGQAMESGMTVEDWAAAAGLNWEALKVPAIADLRGAEFAHLPPQARMAVVPDKFFVTRSDTGKALGFATDVYQPVQPRDVLEWFQRYVGVDSRFELDTAGSLKGGAIIWAQAKFSGLDKIAGEQHKARLLMTTTFDGTGSTVNKGTMTRVVCNNTLDAALGDGGKSVIRTRHNTAFNSDKVSRELARIAESFEAYRAMGEAMAQVDMAAADVSRFFRALLDIPFDAGKDDISTKKMNQFESLSDAYRATVSEGTERFKVWTALNAVTRFVDHDKNTRGGESKEEARVLSAQFGSGAAMKARAVELLMPMVRDKIAA